MTFCVSTGVGTCTKWSTFERDPDHIPDAGTGVLSAISYALQRGILLRRENATGMVNGRSSQQRRVVLRRRNTAVGGHSSTIVNHKKSHHKVCKLLIKQQHKQCL